MRGVGRNLGQRIVKEVRAFRGASLHGLVVMPRD